MNQTTSNNNINEVFKNEISILESFLDIPYFDNHEVINKFYNLLKSFEKKLELYSKIKDDEISLCILNYKTIISNLNPENLNNSLLLASYYKNIIQNTIYFISGKKIYNKTFVLHDDLYNSITSISQHINTYMLYIYNIEFDDMLSLYVQVDSLLDKVYGHNKYSLYFISKDYNKVDKYKVSSVKCVIQSEDKVKKNIIHYIIEYFKYANIYKIDTSIFVSNKEESRSISFNSYDINYYKENIIDHCNIYKVNVIYINYTKPNLKDKLVDLIEINGIIDKYSIIYSYHFYIHKFSFVYITEHKLKFIKQFLSKIFDISYKIDIQKFIFSKLYKSDLSSLTKNSYSSYWNSYILDENESNILKKVDRLYTNFLHFNSCYNSSFNSIVSGTYTLHNKISSRYKQRIDYLLNSMNNYIHNITTLKNQITDQDTSQLDNIIYYQSKFVISLKDIFLNLMSDIHTSDLNRNRAINDLKGNLDYFSITLNKTNDILQEHFFNKFDIKIIEDYFNAKSKNYPYRYILECKNGIDNSIINNSNKVRMLFNILYNLLDEVLDNIKPKKTTSTIKLSIDYKDSNIDISLICYNSISTLFDNIKNNIQAFEKDYPDFYRELCSKKNINFNEYSLLQWLLFNDFGITFENIDNKVSNLVVLAQKIKFLNGSIKYNQNDTINFSMKFQLDNFNYIDRFLVVISNDYIYYLNMGFVLKVDQFNKDSYLKNNLLIESNNHVYIKYNDAQVPILTLNQGMKSVKNILTQSDTNYYLIYYKYNSKTIVLCVNYIVKNELVPIDLIYSNFFRINQSFNNIYKCDKKLGMVI